MDAKYQVCAESQIVKVCGWCLPGNSAWAIPELTPFLLQNYSLSHGMCKGCATQWRKELEATKVKAERKGTFGTAPVPA